MSWYESQGFPPPWDREAWDELVGSLLGLELPVKTVPNLRLLVYTTLAIQRDCEPTEKEETVARATRYMLPGVHSC